MPSVPASVSPVFFLLCTVRRDAGHMQRWCRVVTGRNGMIQNDENCSFEIVSQAIVARITLGLLLSPMTARFLQLTGAASSPVFPGLPVFVSIAEVSALELCFTKLKIFQSHTNTFGKYSKKKKKPENDHRLGCLVMLIYSKGSFRKA